MSRPAKALSASRLNDVILGSFALVPPSETLDHLIRYLSTWSGSDKLFMVIQYTIKLLVPLLNLRARMQHRAGFRTNSVSSSGPGLTKFAGIIGDARTLWRIWGLLPIFQWLISLERNPPPTRNLLTIERLQGWSMLLYYPLEHLSYLASHSVIPTTIPSLSSFLPLTLRDAKPAKPTKLNVDAMGIWSCRFWAAYVLLQFVHLREDRALLKAKGRTLGKAKGRAATADVDKEDLRQRWDAFYNEVVVNLGYLPLTIHWSLEKGLYQNDVWTGVFGLIAAVASFRSGWKATALPSRASSTEVELTTTVGPLVVGDPESLPPILADPGSLLDLPPTTAEYSA